MLRLSLQMLAFILTVCSAESCVVHPDYSEDLGYGYLFIHESSADEYIIKSAVNDAGKLVSIRIEPQIADYKNGRRYILVSQIPIPDSVRYSRYPDIDTYVAQTARRAYFIVDKKRDSLYGPMSFTQYLRQKVRLNIPAGQSLPFERAGPD